MVLVIIMSLWLPGWLGSPFLLAELAAHNCPRERRPSVLSVKADHKYVENLIQFQISKTKFLKWEHSHRAQNSESTYRRFGGSFTQLFLSGVVGPASVSPKHDTLLVSNHLVMATLARPWSAIPFNGRIRHQYISLKDGSFKFFNVMSCFWELVFSKKIKYAELKL